MTAHRTRIQVSGDHDVTIRLPADFPDGEAEVTVLPLAENDGSSRIPFDRWLARLLASLPAAPSIPVEATRRENLYD